MVYIIFKNTKTDSVLSIFGVLQAYLLGLMLKTTQKFDISEFDIITFEGFNTQHCKYYQY